MAFLFYWRDSLTKTAGDLDNKQSLITHNFRGPRHDVEMGLGLFPLLKAIAQTVQLILVKQQDLRLTWVYQNLIFKSVAAAPV